MKRRDLLALVGIGAAAGLIKKMVYAVPAAASSAPDPFVFNEYPAQAAGGIGYSKIAGRTQVSSIISAPSTTKTIITGGQSNHSTAPGTTAYTTVSSQAQNLNIYDGAIYAGADPVLGCSSAPGVGPSSVNMRVADSMISRSKATRCIVVPIAIGGTPFAAWAPSTAGTLFGRISTAILRCRARGLEPDAIFWAEGEADNVAGTSAASVTASIQAIVDGIRALSCTAPFYVGLFTMQAGATSATIRTGITNSVESPRNIKLGYDADTNLTVAGGFRLADQTHLSDTGLSTLATGWTTLAFP